MNIDSYRKFEKRFENKNFENDNLYTDRTLYWSSWFGNLLSVVLAYFFVSTLIEGAAVHFAGQKIILPIFIVLFLTAFELLKRFIFSNVTVSVLLAKKINAKVITGIMFALILITASFYLSLSGAKHYLSKDEQIKQNIDSLISSQIDTLTKRYDLEISKTESKISYTYEAAKERKKKSLTQEEVANIRVWEQDIKTLKQEYNEQISSLKQNLQNKQSAELNESKKSQLAFLLLSSFVELLILVGVGYRQFYAYTCYKIQKQNWDNNPNFKKLEAYKELLHTLFNGGKATPNTQLPSFNKFKQLANAKSKNSDKVLREFLNVVNSLGITNTSGKNRFVKVSYEKAIEILENYISINDK